MSKFKMHYIAVLTPNDIIPGIFSINVNEETGKFDGAAAEQSLQNILENHYDAKVECNIVAPTKTKSKALQDVIALVLDNESQDVPLKIDGSGESKFEEPIQLQQTWMF